MKPDDHRMKILVPDDWIPPKHRYSLPPVSFGRPFLNRYEAPISLVRREKGWCSSDISSPSSGVPLLVGFVKKYRIVPALSLSFDARRRFPPRRLPGSSVDFPLEVLRSLAGLDSPGGLGSGSPPCVAVSGVAAVAPICVLLSMT